MKKSILIIILSCINFVSCQKNDFLYSCDKEADAWVKENFASVRTMTRPEWKELDPVIGRACWGAFTSQQKKRFWEDKLAQVSSLDWSEDEAQHIASLHRFLEENPEIFTGALEKDDALYDKFDRYMYEWADYASATLGWSKNLIGAIAASGYDLTDRTGNWDAVIPDANDNSTMSARACQCSIAHDFCNSPLECMVDPACDEKSWGCGWIIVQACSGMCQMSVFSKPDPGLILKTQSTNSNTNPEL